ncbi:MAG: ABC transporter permease [Cyanobacteria bacterium REEB65]|nr:ABC transporter permease [Cyanobacteria bacterium REEB65]
MSRPVRINLIGLWMLARREVKRTFKILNQVIWPPVISTLLYFFIFVIGLGRAVGRMEGMSYVQFLVPGLIFMNVVEASFGEGAASLFLMRFSSSIQEILVAPLSYAEMVLGMLSGSILRALVIGNLILLVSWPFGGGLPHHWLAYLGLIVAVSVLFSSLGLIMALWAESFDQLSIATTFFITPMVFLGGVFTSAGVAYRQLPPGFRQAVFYNPMLYLVDGFRTAMTGHLNPFSIRLVGHLMPMWTLDLLITAIGAVGAFWLTMSLFRSGFKLRT